MKLSKLTAAAILALTIALPTGQVLSQEKDQTVDTNLNQAGENLQDAGKALGNSVDNTGEAAKQGIENTGEAAEKDLNNAGQAVERNYNQVE
jgi:ABC-type transporter Mla subunit MlaD